MQPVDLKRMSTDSSRPHFSPFSIFFLVILGVLSEPNTELKVVSRLEAMRGALAVMGGCLVLSFTGLLTSLLLVVGVKTEQRMLLLPWQIFHAGTNYISNCSGFHSRLEIVNKHLFLKMISHPLLKITHHEASVIEANMVNTLLWCENLVWSLLHLVCKI